MPTIFFFMNIAYQLYILSLLETVHALTSIFVVAHEVPGMNYILIHLHLAYNILTLSQNKHLF